MAKFISLLFFILTIFLYPVIKSEVKNLNIPFLNEASIESATVVRVIDGDTIELTDGRKVRLKGIDCPESGQFHGNVAKTYLKAAIENTSINIETHYTDQYQRLVAVVYYGDININRFMVQQGHCWAYRRYTDDAELFALENRAKQARIGLWAYSNPQPPWEFRHNK